MNLSCIQRRTYWRVENQNSTHHDSNNMLLRFAGLSQEPKHLIYEWYKTQKIRHCQITHDWSPLKSPKATTLPSPFKPIEPASSKLLPVNRFGGNGHHTAWDAGRKMRACRPKHKTDDIRRRPGRLRYIVVDSSYSKRHWCATCYLPPAVIPNKRSSLCENILIQVLKLVLNQ